MRRVLVSSKRPWESSLKAAQGALEEDGRVVLVAKSQRAHRNLMKVYRAFRFPRRHDPLSPPETWPLRAGEINPLIYVDQDSGHWHLQLAPGQTDLDERGVPAD